MSELFVRLVAGLTPPRGRRYYATAPTDARDRFVLFTLAYLADEQGVSQISLTNLAAITLHPPDLIRTSIRSWEERGVVIRTQKSGNEANTYRLVRPVLEREQFDVKLYDGQSVWEIERLGASTRTVNALMRHDIRSMTELGRMVAAYRALPIEDQNGFHRFLDARNLGAVSAQQALDAYDAWCADSEGRA